MHIIPITKYSIIFGGHMKHLLKLSDLTAQELAEILVLAEKLKKEAKQGIFHPYLTGKTLAMIFSKASTRTRISFEVGMYQLGGSGLFINGCDSQMERGEPICDTARVLSRFVNGIMIRTYKQSDVEGLAKFGTVPVINGLTDYCHPCQVVADLLTIKEYKGDLSSLKMCYIGDGNNVANSLIAGAALTGMQLTVACPEGYEPDEKMVELGKQSGTLTVTEDIEAAISGADAVYTDVWASMGMEKEAEERKKVFKSYQVNEKVMGLAQKDAMVLHCLPAHRGEEITAETLEKHSDEIFTQAENRLHAQKAIMVKLMG